MSSLMNGGAESEVVIVIFCERSLPRAAAAGTFPNIGQISGQCPVRTYRELWFANSGISRELWLLPPKKDSNFCGQKKNEKQQLQYLKIISLSNYLPVPVLRTYFELYR